MAFDDITNLKNRTMAKLQLTFYGVEGTVDSNGVSIKNETLNISTGSEIKEAKCYFSVSYTGKRITENDKDTITENIKGDGPVHFALNAQNIRFMKQMYSPNYIFAEIQIAPEQVKQGNQTTYYKADVSRDILEKAFVNKKVVLTSDNNKEVCNDYYVYEIVPKYKKDAMYVSLKMYSPDHLLTQEEYCRSFVTKKLGSGILTEEIQNYDIPYATNDDEKRIKIDFANMKHLKKDSQEHIFPYLVQYNESFYDFLKRTTNRWGEFLYYEGGELHIGYKDDNGSDNYRAYVDTWTYCDLTTNKPKQKNAGSYHSENVDDELNTKLEKGKYDKVIGQLNSLDDFKDKSGDVYVMKKVANILNNEKTLFNFIVDELVDDTIALLQANKVSDEKNDKFNSDYFGKNKKGVTFNAEQFSDNIFSEFSEFNPIVDASKYAAIVKKEMASGKNAVMIDFDTTYPDLKLGQTILVDNKKYLIVQVEGYQPERMKIVKNEYFETVVDTRMVVFKVTAIPQNRIKVEADKGVDDTKFYPSLLPEGHIKHSGMQRATVVDVDDPLRKNRVRVRFDWQPSSEIPSPWLIYASAAGSPKAGIHGQHYINEPVVVDFINGNIERPYVVGSVEQEMPGPLKTTSIVHMTPAGQSIKMSDGTGAGMTAFLASFNPGFKMIQGFYPGQNVFTFAGDKDQYFEGNIELTDKYGIWSIKGSTNDRNISIKSPWGDVKMSAFTGITISAPNGDVKISGKNVSIEAGSNLTLKSGKNIKQKFYNDAEDLSLMSITTHVTKIVTKKTASTLFSVTDMTLLRHIVELIVKPVEGKLQMTAGRYLMMEAGSGKTDYPVDAYSKPQSTSGFEKLAGKPIDISRSFEKITPITNEILNRYKALYTSAFRIRPALETGVNNCKNKNNEPQCKTLEEIINALWNNPDDVKAAIGFKGICEKDLTYNQEIEWPVFNNFLSLGVVGMQRLNEDKDFAKNKWKYVVDQQNRLKRPVLEAARQLAGAIALIKSFNIEFIVSRMYGGYEKVKDIMKQNKLPADCILSNISTRDDYKKFKADFNLIQESERKKINRKFFIELVNAYGFKRMASPNPGGIGKGTVPAEPQPDCSDADWTAYVNSIQELPKKPEPGAGAKFVKDALADPISQAFLGGFDKVEAFFDDFAWGSSKKGQILFSGSEGTMVLDKNIYRANVDFSEESLIGEKRLNGFAKIIRDAMMQS